MPQKEDSFWSDLHAVRMSIPGCGGMKMVQETEMMRRWWAREEHKRTGGDWFSQKDENSYSKFIYCKVIYLFFVWKINSDQ